MQLNDGYIGSLENTGVLQSRFNGALFRSPALFVNRAPRISPVPVMMFLMFLWLLAGNICQVPAQFDFEQLPIDYHRSKSDDSLMELQSRLQSHEIHSRYDTEKGYLPWLLKELKVSESSQVLVFSKTSAQVRRISPSIPRAIYFNDHTYVAWIPRAELIEIMAVDAQLGPVFYTLGQTDPMHVRFRRDQGQCLLCHASPRTQRVPGAMVRSMQVDINGLPLFEAPHVTTDHRTPFVRRWGGWYVTGKHATMRHMGNTFLRNRRDPEPFNYREGANQIDLGQHVKLDLYPTPHSDLVALMVLEHQSQMLNHLTKANFETRMAVDYDNVLNRALDRPMDFRSKSTRRRIASVGERLVKYLLFIDEYRLKGSVFGTSQFTTVFASAGPRDRQGRSLRDFDLERSLFKYPCSYMIYTPSFTNLPDTVRDYVTRRMQEILFSSSRRPPFDQLSDSDCRNVREILADTLPGLWRPTISN